MTGTGKVAQITIQFSLTRPRSNRPWLSDNGGLPIQAVITCVVTSMGRNRFGQAECSINDQFSRPVGRKIALTRAVAGFPKSERRRVWEAYFKRVAR